MIRIRREIVQRRVFIVDKVGSACSKRIVSCYEGTVLNGSGVFILRRVSITGKVFIITLVPKTVRIWLLVA